MAKNPFKKLAEKKREQALRRPRPMFREGSRTSELAYLFASKGRSGYVTQDEIIKQVCDDLLLISNKYERMIKIAMRSRTLIRDIRNRSGVFIGKVWIPAIQDFAWKILQDKDEFGQVIKQIQSRIDSLEAQKSELEEARDSGEYETQVEVFFNSRF